MLAGLGLAKHKDTIRLDTLDVLILAGARITVDRARTPRYVAQDVDGDHIVSGRSLRDMLDNYETEAARLRARIPQ